MTVTRTDLALGHRHSVTWWRYIYCSVHKNAPLHLRRQGNTKPAIAPYFPRETESADSLSVF